MPNSISWSIRSTTLEADLREMRAITRRMFHNIWIRETGIARRIPYPLAARSDRSPACAAAVVPARRYYDRRHLHGSGSSAEGARGRAVVAEHQETQSATHIRPWSAQPGFRWNQ